MMTQYFLKSLFKKIFNNFFWGQHPETALRYLPVVAAIKKMNLANSKILEIGSGSLGITPYFQREIDSIDTDFSGLKSPFLKKIKGTAFELPFRKNNYDVAISVDVLEHLPKEKREESILEMLRVAKKLVIIVVPVGEQSEKQDRNLNKLWQKVYRTRYQFLEEHVKNGLPRADEIFVYIDKSLRKLKKKAKVSSSPLLNLKIRYILMRTWISQSRFLYYLYMKGYMLLVPILQFANFGSCYRRIFVIQFENT